MPNRKPRKGKRWIWIAPLAILGAGGITLGVLASTYQPRIYPEYRLGDATISGSATSLDEQLNAWWDSHQFQAVKFTFELSGDHSVAFPMSELGVSMDLAKTRSQFKYTNFFDDLLGKYRSDEAIMVIDVDPILQVSAVDTEPLEEFVSENRPATRPALATLVSGSIELLPEVNTVELDIEAVPAAIAFALENNNQTEIPVKQAPKKIPDEELKKITTVVSTFTTSFKESQTSRSTNLRVAMKALNGQILMPGDSFSFNGALGKRTTQKGYKLAGVYVNGRHDFDIGGGICQVSTTMYNAVLLAGMMADSRSPHSLPVPYVPLGRDAAVSFPAPDLKFTNKWSTPLAISGNVEGGKITFSILGVEKSDTEYQFVTKYISSWSHGEKIVHDGSLPYGVRKVVDKGGGGRSVQTWKITMRDGKEVERVDMGVSSYRGGPRIVAVNKSAKPSAGGGGEIVTLPAREHEDHQDGIGVGG